MRRLTELFLVILTAFMWVACSGTAATDACADVTCEAGQSCVDGACQADEAEGNTGDESDATDPETDDESDTPDQTDPDPDPEPTGAPCESVDDCAEDLICEDTQCVAPRGEECSPDVPCAAGFDCISTAAGSSCMEACEETTDCQAAERCWADGEGSLLGDLGGYCFINLCGPPDNFGILQAAEFMGTCNALGTGDGICFGPVAESQLGDMGVCMNAAGELGAGSACDSSEVQANPSGLCSNGFCTPADVCLEFCNTSSDDTCEPLPNGAATSCSPAAPLEGSIAGLCQPEATEEEESEDGDDAPTEEPADDGSD